MLCLLFTTKYMYRVLHCFQGSGGKLQRCYFLAGRREGGKTGNCAVSRSAHNHANYTVRARVGSLLKGQTALSSKRGARSDGLQTDRHHAERAVRILIDYSAFRNPVLHMNIFFRNNYNLTLSSTSGPI